MKKELPKEWKKVKTNKKKKYAVSTQFPLEKEFNLSEKIKPAPFETNWNNDGEPTEHTWKNVCFVNDIKEFIKRENTEIFTEGFWNYVWINYFDKEDEEIFQKMVKHIEERVKEKRMKLAGDKLT